MDKETQAKLEGIAVAAGLAALVAILQYLKDNLPALFPGATWLPIAGVAIAAALAIVSQNQRWLNTPAAHHISAPSLAGVITAVAPAVEQAIISEATAAPSPEPVNAGPGPSTASSSASAPVTTPPPPKA